MTDALVTRFLERVAQIAARPDVIIEEFNPPTTHHKVDKWQSILPADMFNFYRTINGFNFYYRFLDDPNGYNGVRILSIERDGKKLYRAKGGYLYYSIPRQHSKKYPDYFFQDAPDDKVMFFIGSDDAWGVLMIGEGESASFQAWDNDGFRKYLAGTFTEVIDKLLRHGLAHTWAYDDHSETRALLARLDQPADHNISLHVHTASLIPAADKRRALIATHSKKLIRALSITDIDKSTPADALIDRLEQALTDPALDDAAASKVIKAIGAARQGTLADLKRHLHIGLDAIADLTLTLTYTPAAGDAFAEHDDMHLLVRALYAIQGEALIEGSPIDPTLLRFAHPSRYGFWHPFLAFSGEDFAPTAEGRRAASFHIQLPAPAAQGLAADKTYAASIPIRPLI